MAGTPKKMALWAKLQSDKDKVLEDIARGVSQRALADRYGVSQRMIHEWLFRTDVHPLFEKAMQIRAENLAEQAREIADEEPRLHPATGALDPAAIAHAKLRIDTRKWEASRLNPNRWGDKVQIDGKLDVAHTFGSFLQDVRGDKLAQGEVIEGELVPDLISDSDS